MFNWIATSCFSILACALAAEAVTQQQAVPPLIKFIVPAAPGAATDVAARAVAMQLGKRLGNTVIVDNKAGASTIIGTQSVMNAPHDGSTLLFASSSIVSTPATMRNFPFDVTTALVPISVVSDGPMLVVVAAKSGIKTPAELVAAARAKPEGLAAGSAGVGSIGHLAVELLNQAAGIQIRHIPYKGAAPAVTDIAAGNIDTFIGSYSSVAPHLQSGRVVAIAVTSAEPSPAYPGMPTMASAAPGYHASIWYGLFAPAGTPQTLIELLNRDVNAIARTPEFAKILQMDGASPVTATPDELRKFVRDSYATWKKVATEKNIVVD